MDRLFQPLLFILARSSRNQLIRKIEFLKTENEILRKHIKMKHLVLRPEESRRLVELGERIGPAVKHVLTMACHSTYRRWVRRYKGRQPVPPRGRPEKPNEIRELVLRIASETGWGYTRILGEIRKLGILGIPRQTVVNILKKEGFDPWPKRGPGTWDELLKMHAETLWQCDFFSKRFCPAAALARRSRWCF